MRLLHVICVLLAITISCVAATDTTGAKESDKKIVRELPTAVSNTSIPATNSLNDKDKPTSPLPANETKTTQPTVVVTTPCPTLSDAPTTSATKPSNKTSDVPVNPPPKPSDPTVKPDPSTKPTVKPTVEPTTIPTSPASTEASSTTAANPGTTMASPSSPVPSKERQFDGLSFLGGTIFAVCLMGLGAFSWKFYRSCSEQNYRTL